jgi:Tfp pilus assembly protein PilP
MKPTIAILVLTVATGAAWGQHPNVIQNTRDNMKALQVKKKLDSDAALGSAARPAAQPTASHSTNAASKHRTEVPAKVTARRVVAVHNSKAPKHEGEAAESAKTAAASTPAASAPQEHKHINVSGRRDPFVNPVVSQSATGSGCSVGKRCLAIDQIALKGVVKSDSGMIAVVVNALDKAYFLRENDPVFNGYVVRITGDSIIFKETVQDKLGKPFTREVTKKITTPAV